MSNTLRLTEQLISRASVTPDDAGCQTIISDLLKPLGFSCETVFSGPDTFKVENLWAKKLGQAGSKAPLLVFAGHTDVVPTGPLAQWTHDPFSPTIQDGKLYGYNARYCRHGSYKAIN